MFKVGCFGYGGNVALVEQFREELVLNGCQLITCHEYENATFKYDYDTNIYKFFDACDIIILPSRTRLQPAKSINRLAFSWSQKKACVVAPLPSYNKYAVHEENVLIADTFEDWISCIFRLRDDEALRNKLANSGHATATKHLHPRHQVTKLFGLLSQHGLIAPWPVETCVRIIIPHYAERLDYLELAVETALASWGPSREIVVVSSATADPREFSSYLATSKIKVIQHTSRLSFSEANNLALKMSNEHITHYLLLNDDTVMGHTALGSMMRVMLDHGNNFLLNPWSNCDKGWLHSDNFILSTGKDLHPNMTIEEFTEEEIEEIKNYQGVDTLKDKQIAKFCAMYCTLIPKDIVNRVGYLNTEFLSGGEDLDYGERAKRFGFESNWTRDAWCFHFGGKTRMVAEKEDSDTYHKQDVANNLLATKRWPKDRKRIAIWTGPAWETWDLDSYITSGIGGSEMAAARLAQTAAAEGHLVYMYGAHDRCEQNGVQLIPWNEFIPEEEYFDLFIASRNLNCIDERLKAKKVLVWIHDIWLLSGQHISDFHKARVNKFICLTPWHKNFVSQHHSLSKDMIDIIPNGLNVELFDTPDVDKKKFGNLIYSSSPDRGLDNLLYILPFIKEQVPEVHLDIYYGFHNYESAVKSRNVPTEVEQLNKLKDLIELNKDIATMHGRIPQNVLAQKWQEAYIWLYPTNFTETFCLTAKEAQLSATPIICSDVAGLATTVGEYGHMVEHHPYSQEGRIEYVEQAIKMFKNKDYWLECSKKSLKGSKNISWQCRWDNFWKKYI